MFGSAVSLASNALHSPWQSRTLGVVRPVQPVVGRGRDDGNAVPANATLGSSTNYSPQPPANGLTPLYSRTGKPSSSSGVFAVAIDHKDTFDLQVRTAEGDVATLRYERSDSATVSAATSASGAQSGFALEGKISQQVDLHIDVQGKLSDAERAAISALAQQVGSVASDFFAGNVDLAVKDAGQIDISKQAQILAAYDLKLESRDMQAAAAIYEDVANTTGTLNVQVPQATPKPAAVGPSTPSQDFLRSITEAKSDPGTSSLMKGLMALFETMSGSAP